MRRAILACLLLLGATLNAAAVAAAPPTRIELARVSLPAAAEVDATVALEFSLPARAAAVEGRLLFDTAAAEVVGLAPAGGGVALRPQELADGVAFGAYNLRARGGRTTLRVVLAPLAPGELELRLVIDGAADANGRRLALAGGSKTVATRVGRVAQTHQAPFASARPAPRNAAGAIRDVVADGALGSMDLDAVRVAWELGQLNGASCGGDLAADANADGCIDIVDIQAVAAGQGSRTTAPLRPTGDTQALIGVRSPNRQSITAITPTPGNTFVVTSTADTSDANNGDGLCADSQGRCTLRAAITESNWQRGDNVVHFNLSGSLPVVIQYSSSPMSIIQDRSGGLLIDGYSQPGSRVNTAQYGSNAIMGVELRGTQSSPRGNALRITSANNVVRGLSFTRFYRPVVLDGARSMQNQIVGNWMGFTRSGSVDDYRGSLAVVLDAGANHNQVGGAAVADRNVIGNFTHAVDFYGPATQFNLIIGNLLCTTPSGNSTASCATAIDTNFGPKRNVMGGRGAGEGNIIGRTSLNGIEISHGWNPDGSGNDDTWSNDYNEILGNWIGFRGDGRYDADFRSGQNTPNSNDGNGVNVYDGSNYNLVEGNWVGAVWDGINLMSPNATGNTVRNNIIGESPRGERAPLSRYGINVRNNTRTHFIEGNIVRNTGSHAIALIQKDVLWVRISRNIVSDTNADAIYLAVDRDNSSLGANALQPAPVISSATTARVRGTGEEGATVEVYRASRNAGQYGLPSEYLGSALVGAGGLWEVPVNLAVGTRVTALQISASNNTSELSANVSVSQDQTPPNVIAADQFGRTQADSWGLADSGGAYTLSGTAANYDVAGGVGTIRLPSAGNSRSALLTGVNARDVDITFRVAADKVAAGGMYVVYAVARRVGTSEYRGRLIFNATGGMSLNASLFANGSETSLGTPVALAGLTQQAGRNFWVRMRVSGASPTTISLKAWVAGQAEPATWQFSATNSNAAVQGNGSVGLRAWLGRNVTNAAVIFSFDDYTVTPAI